MISVYYFTTLLYSSEVKPIWEVYINGYCRHQIGVQEKSPCRVIATEQREKVKI